MNTAVAVQNIQARLPMPTGLNDLDAGKWRVLCESVFPNAKSMEAIVMAVDYCKARKLDVFKRPVNIVPMWNKSLGKEVETIWPSINEVQTTAARTGKYAGMDEPKWGPDKTRTFEGILKWREGNLWKEEALKIEITYPEWCSVTVYRLVEGQKCAFTEPVFWEEAYAHRGKTEVPNDMWTKRTRGQLLKVAKAFSLRAAFPEEGEYTAEEMEGREIASGGVVIENRVQHITPSDTDLSKPKSPFGNAARRKEFQVNVTTNFHAAKTPRELTDLMELDKPRFAEMEASGAEADHLALGEIRKQFQIAWNRLAIAKPEDATFDQEEEIPPYIRQQMEEERELRAAKGNF